jgi:hypothetical protein
MSAIICVRLYISLRGSFYVSVMRLGFPVILYNVYEVYY